MAVSLSQGCQALREGAALLDLAGRGVIRVTGEDRSRLLHAMTTNHIQQLLPGQSCYALFLNAQGRILADANILCLHDAFLLDTGPDSRSRVFEHLDKLIIADDVALEDMSEAFAVIGLEGPRSGEVLAKAGLTPELPASHTWVEWGDRIVAGLSATGAPGFRLFVASNEKAALLELLLRAGAVEAGDQDGLVIRLENARPLHGVDFSENVIPHEAQLLHALHFNKWCYLGQEIVERVRSRGRVHRTLLHLEIDTDEAPAAGATILSGEKEAGEITSAAYSPASGKVFAFGYVRSEQLDRGVPLTVEGATARPTGKKPA